MAKRRCALRGLRAHDLAFVSSTCRVPLPSCEVATACGNLPYVSKSSRFRSMSWRIARGRSKPSGSATAQVMEAWLGLARASETPADVRRARRGCIHTSAPPCPRQRCAWAACRPASRPCARTRQQTSRSCRRTFPVGSKCETFAFGKFAEVRSFAASRSFGAIARRIASISLEMPRSLAVKKMAGARAGPRHGTLDSPGQVERKEPLTAPPDATRLGLKMF